MAGYSEYVMDLVSSATSVADQARQAVVGGVTGLAQSAQQKLLSYKYDPESRIMWDQGDQGAADQQDQENVDFPSTDSPVWLLGRQLSAKYDLCELRSLVRARPWLSYRKQFPPIGSSGLTSDQGWGCMLRCGQMVLAGALMDLRLRQGEDQEYHYVDVMSKFLDVKSAQYSIHQIALMGESVDKKPVGTWFGPNLVAQVLRKLCKYSANPELVVHVAMDNSLVLQEVRDTCSARATGEKTEEESSTWKPLLLFISLRLGLAEINPVYIPGLKACLEFPQSLGVIGGKPNHALYFLGYVEDEVIYLDPHTTQQAGSDWSSYHVSSPGRIHMSELDPSLSLCFLATSEQEFDNLCINIQEKLIEGCKTPLFEMLVERPPHMYSKHMSVPSDCSVQPDESTGQDYEQVERKYDSDNEFEIIE